MSESIDRNYDPEDRLLDYGAEIINICRQLTRDFVERHVGGQLLRSGTAPLSHHGEAQGAESNADFIHKMHLAFKELKESARWIKLLKRANLQIPNDRIGSLLDKTDQLVRIFAASIRTAQKQPRKHKKPS